MEEEVEKNNENVFYQNNGMLEIIDLLEKRSLVDYNAILRGSFSLS